MEVGEANSSSLKRARTPLSDTEGNIVPPTEVNDGQKRRRLDVAGQENCSPKVSSSGRLAELKKRQDTPIVPSVRSRLEQLTQKHTGGAPLAQRCLSDPGADNKQDKVFRECLLGEDQFHQRVECFEALISKTEASPTPSPVSSQNRSDFVSGIQQKLQDTATPSSKQASRIRQEREQELNQLQFQPISENAWLKRSSSDPSLSQQADDDTKLNDGSFTEASAAYKPAVDTTDVELSFHDETNTAEIIDQMFDEVLEYAGKMQESRADEEDTEDHDSGIRTCMTEKEKMETKERKDPGEVGDGDEEQEESELLESNADELLTFPPSCILSPLSKSVEAAVTPLRLAAGLDSNPPSLLLTPGDTSTPMAESAPLYSVDAYRTLHQSKPPTIQSATPSAPRRAVEKPSAPPSVNSKEKIAALNGEAAKLQNVINQTLQALSCCTDEEHGRGSLEEAEAEKLLLVSCEKRAALLAEVARLRDERNSESVAGSKAVIQQQPCRGTVTITNIQLPLKVEFVCSSHSRPGRPSHYFFILIRYGPCNIVATPLATAADAQNGDTISFPTSVTLKDIRSTFEIDVEVYSLSHTSASSCTTDRASIRSRVTPRKLLNTLTQSNNSMGSTGLSRLTRRSSDFSLVGSHKITLASLGHSKFPLDKMKLEGKIRRLLGDEFQEKVPFLSPLEGSIYLKLDSQGHSHVQHQGFLTMFEMISGFGMWHRRYFALDGCSLLYWNHPNDQEDKEPVGRVSLSSSSTECVRPVNRDLCARPFTFELVRSQQQEQAAMTKCWFSADTKEERLDWIEKLNQALLDFRTWSRVSACQTETQQTAKSRESLL
ncbi:anillin isoform X3 [Synchiropus splendidus]|uniref:anillin isoform X3 n=1 Tax=Synchiropus splendidus TaxID=270530 RepID=UPI00237EC9AE|nr:anillin isoform X3 [Synchiropus splendidus]